MQANFIRENFTMKNFFILNGRVLDPSQNLDKKINIEIRNGKIYKFFSNKIKNIDSLNHIDAKGFIVSPGFIDLHVHLRDPGLTHKETIGSGSKAAAFGGFTSIACMPNTSPPNDNPKITNYIMKKSKRDSLVKIYPIGAITKGQDGKSLAKIKENIHAGCIGISDDGFPVTNSSLLYDAMNMAKDLQVPLISHCEECSLSKNGVINEGFVSRKNNLPGIPNISEELGILRDIFISDFTGCHLHICHVSTEGSVKIIKDAKGRGSNITCEAAPHHFTLSEKDIDIKNSNFKMNPPLRSDKDKKAIIDGLKDGTIDIIATDHAPHAKKEKKTGFLKAPFGIIGLETALPLSLNLVRNKKITMMNLIKKLSFIPAKIAKIEAGSLKKGNFADITIFDPNEKFNYSENLINSKSKNSPLINKFLQGKVKYTFVNGNLIYDDRK